MTFPEYVTDDDLPVIAYVPAFKVDGGEIEVIEGRWFVAARRTEDWTFATFEVNVDPDDRTRYRARMGEYDMTEGEAIRDMAERAGFSVPGIPAPPSPRPGLLSDLLDPEGS